MAERIWDEIDRKASREGDAMRRMRGYSPTMSHTTPAGKIPKRIFTNGLCFRVEGLTPQGFKKHLRNGDLLTL
jgi:hypothetical protein